MPDDATKLRAAPPYGLHPQFRQVLAESLCAGAEGELLRIGIGSIAPEMGDAGTARRVVTDFELLLTPATGRYLLETISKWLEELEPSSDAPGRPKGRA